MQGSGNAPSSENRVCIRSCDNIKFDHGRKGRTMAVDNFCFGERFSAHVVQLPVLLLSTASCRPIEKKTPGRRRAVPSTFVRSAVAASVHLASGCCHGLDAPRHVLRQARLPRILSLASRSTKLKGYISTSGISFIHCLSIDNTALRVPKGASSKYLQSILSISMVSFRSSYPTSTPTRSQMAYH